MTSILMNNGDGTFQQSVDYEKIGQDPHVIAAFDINGDTHMDLLIPGYRNQKVHMLLNQGDGTFELAEEYHPGFTALGVFVSDLDGDSQPELLITGFREMIVQSIKGES